MASYYPSIHSHSLAVGEDLELWTWTLYERAVPANEDSYIANKLNCGIENELGCEQAIAGMTRSYRALRWARAVRAGLCEGRGLFRAGVWEDRKVGVKGYR